jgi:N-methylhydantoinase A
LARCGMINKRKWRIGVDIGGTFTDLVLLADDGALVSRKVPSTPEDYSRAISDGLRQIMHDVGIEPMEIRGLVHATTVAANIILERKGAVTGLVTTEGFRDVLEMRRLRIPVMYDLQYRKPEPLAPRRLRLEVPERLGPRGEIRRPLEQTAVVDAARRLKAEGVEAVAVSFLHSYANAQHEEATERILHLELGDDVFICRSSEIIPEIREYERTSTAVVNAYIGPVVAKYLNSLVGRLRGLGLKCPVEIMHSAGGTMRLDAAIRKAAYLIESGPAAGVIAAARVARAGHHHKVISFDMGGTTVKAAIVERGEPARTAEYEVGAGINLSSRLVKGGGYAVKLPYIDVSEIGAGGGSIVSIDPQNRLTVGPKSAGAVPGPVCYGRGGAEATLTDALVALGHLNPSAIAGGSLRLSAEAARKAILEQVATPLGKSPLEAAWGVLTITVASMTRAVKAVSTYRGRDPRDFTLVTFGGNGPIVAAQIARALNMRRVIVPPAAGVFSALGLLYADTEHEFVNTIMTRTETLTDASLSEHFTKLDEQAFAAMMAGGYARDTIELVHQGDLRYAGQAYELTISASGSEPLSVASLINAFHEEHQRTYGYRSDGAPTDLVTVRVIARVPCGAPPARRVLQEIAPTAPAARREAFFGREYGSFSTPILARADLGSKPCRGPIIIEEYDATCLVPPNACATLDELGNIAIELEAEGK